MRKSGSTTHKALRHFVDAAGTYWRIEELPVEAARQVFPDVLLFEDPTTVSLVFSARGRQRYVAHAPPNWHDLSFTAMLRLLMRATPRDGTPVIEPDVG